MVEEEKVGKEGVGSGESESVAVSLAVPLPPSAVGEARELLLGAEAEAEEVN